MGLLTKEKNRSFLDQDIFFQAEGNFRVLSCRLPLLTKGDEEGLPLSDYFIVLTRKFCTSCLRLYFSERFKQQLGQVLNLGLVVGAIAQVTPC